MLMVTAIVIVFVTATVGDVAQGAFIAGVFTLLNTALNLHHSRQLKKLRTEQRRARTAANEATAELVDMASETRGKRGTRGDTDA